jgi:hypothetical protein
MTRPEITITGIISLDWRCLAQLLPVAQVKESTVSDVSDIDISVSHPDIEVNKYQSYVIKSVLSRIEDKGFQWNMKDIYNLILFILNTIYLKYPVSSMYSIKFVNS